MVPVSDNTISMIALADCGTLRGSTRFLLTIALIVAAYADSPEVAAGLPGDIGAGPANGTDATCDGGMACVCAVPLGRSSG